MYLRFFKPYGEKDFGFITEDMCNDNDIYITDDEHKKFFSLLKEGYQFRIINRNGKNLFEVLEKYKNKIEYKKTQIEDIQDEQAIQDGDILTSMMANAEMFEIVLNLKTNTQKRYTTLNEPQFPNKSIVELYVTLIRKGAKSLDEVPDIIKDQVENRLEELNR